MLDLDVSKEIILRKNEDGTYNLITKHDIYNSDKITLNSEVECNYLKVKINSFDVELLSTGNIMTQKLL